MATDWNFMRQRFPSLPDEPTYEDVLAAGRRECDGKTLDELTQTLADVRARADVQEQVLSGINAERVALETVVIGRLQDQGLKTANLAGGGRFTIVEELTVKTTDREALRKWTIENGFDDLMTWNAQTLASEYRKWFKNSLPLPDGVESDTRTKLSFTGRNTRSK